MQQKYTQILTGICFCVTTHRDGLRQQILGEVSVPGLDERRDNVGQGRRPVASQINCQSINESNETKQKKKRHPTHQYAPFW